tara:strand:- start:153 stop:770 length:618 start_codon:yes stop_codon:yes gene_type:complete
MSDMADQKDGFERMLDESNDVCMQSLEANWDGILASAILEIIQWAFDAVFAVFNFTRYIGMMIPIIGIFPLWLSELALDGLAPDWTRTYAHGAQANLRMARNNARCASNIYVKFGENLKPDYKFAGDTEFYLNSISAAQNFYVAFMDWRDGVGVMYTMFPLGPAIELVYRGASLAMPIATWMLYSDISQLKYSPEAEKGVRGEGY